MYQNKIANGKIVNIKILTQITDENVVKHNYTYEVHTNEFGFRYFNSDELFTSKQDLLNSL